MYDVKTPLYHYRRGGEEKKNKKSDTRRVQQYSRTRARKPIERQKILYTVLYGGGGGGNERRKRRVEKKKKKCSEHNWKPVTRPSKMLAGRRVITRDAHKSNLISTRRMAESGNGSTAAKKRRDLHNTDRLINTLRMQMNCARRTDGHARVAVPSVATMFS